MKLYPINLDIAGKPCTVIGGGQVALRKIRGLLEAAAVVHVIAPEVCAEVEELFQRGEIFLTREKFSPDMLGDEILLIAATDNPEVNRQAAESARAKKILANVANGAGGNFFVPSRIARGDLLLTVSTSANSPAFARFVRLMLESDLDDKIGAGLELIARRRAEIKRLLPDADARKNFWREVLTPDLWQHLRKGQFDAVNQLLDDKLSTHAT